MITYERQVEILNYLRSNNCATFKELAKAVYASESSVRRDIKSLEAQGYVKQTYGGVVLASYVNEIVPLKLREGKNTAAKDTVAKEAAKYIFDGATLLLDGSSTVRRLIKYINRYESLKIITNNHEIFSELQNEKVTVYSTGGRFDPQNKIFLGSTAEEYVRNISADILFFSSQAISEDGEISDVSEEETSLRRVMLSRAKKKIFLCDSSKLGLEKTFRLCSKNDVDVIVCDKKLPWE
ncbi:MAG: DeoR/GlpR transcriptional regulator [Clostridia bacterium]|nr:DeoR/GlpR transcriptional regulator [Clostridia bacterium]